MATVTWAPQGGSNDWSTAINWSPNGVPGITAAVVIPNATNIAELQTGASVASVSLANGASWNVAAQGSTVAIAGDFVDNGGFSVDGGFLTNPGGTLVAIGGTLTVTNSGGGFGVGNRAQTTATTVTAGSVTNTGAIDIAGNAANTGVLAQIDVASVAGFGGMAGVLTGDIGLGIGVGGAGGVGDALLDFTGGGLINTIENGAVQLTGPKAYIASGTTLADKTSNSALTGPLTIASGGTLGLQSGTQISTGPLTDNGNINVDTGFLATGGSQLNVAGTLTVAGSLSIGRSAMIGNVDGVVNVTGALAGAGSIFLDGADASDMGELIVSAAAGFGGAGVVTGNIAAQDYSLLQFGGGPISTIAYGGSVTVIGPHAFVANQGGATSNSALQGLAQDYGAFSLESGATLTTNGAVAIGDPNTFHFTSFHVDDSATGGSTLHVQGALTLNAGAGVSIGNTGITAATTVTATALDFVDTDPGESTSIAIEGSTTAAHQSTLDVASVAGSNGTAGLLSDDTVSLLGDSLLDFAGGGGITTVTFGANIIIDGPNAYVASGAATSGNTALNGLANLYGSLVLHDGASLTTAGMTVGNGANGASLSVDSGAGLVVNGLLDLVSNEDQLHVGQGSDSVATEVLAAGLEVGQSADVEISGNPGAGVHGTLDIVGAVSDVGSVNLSNGGLLDIGGSVGGGGTVLFEGGGGELKLDTTLAPVVAVGGFVTGDVIDLAALSFTASRRLAFSPAGTGGTLAVSNGAATADIQFAGPYTTAEFVERNDGTGGTLIAREPTASDFNGDGYSDVLYLNPNGALAMWELNNTQVIGGGVFETLAPGWTVSGIGDFNGDGKSDILLSTAAGALAMWEMNGTNVIGGGSIGSLGTGWSVVGTGDFNDDGHADVLFQNTSGALGMWQMNGTAIIGGSGDFENLGANSGWSVVGTGDFNGDSNCDILLANANGSVAMWEMNGVNVIGGGVFENLGANSVWTIAGVGDFNGDGKSDILLTNANGAVAMWEMNGTSVIGGGVFQNLGAGSGWSVAGVGDYNGDGLSDILLHNANGATAIWDMTGAVVAGGGSPGQIPSPWIIEHG